MRIKTLLSKLHIAQYIVSQRLNTLVAAQSAETCDFKLLTDNHLASLHFPQLYCSSQTIIYMTASSLCYKAGQLWTATSQ